MTHHPMTLAHYGQPAESFAQFFDAAPQPGSHGTDFLDDTGGTDLVDAARHVLHGFESLDDAEVEQALQGLLQGMSPEEAENFLNTLAGVGRSIAGGLSGVVQPLAGVAGTALGTAFGGPVGAALGGTLGTALGGFAAQGLGQLGQAPRRRPQPVARPRPPQPRFAPSPMPRAPFPQPQRPAMPAFGPGLHQGINEILGLLQSPQIQQALANAAVGISGQVVNRAGQAMAGEQVVGALRNRILALADALAEVPETAIASPHAEDFADWAGGL